MNVKQVIVVRTDLKMSAGRIAGQVAHASLAALKDQMEYDDSPVGSEYTLHVVNGSALDYWWHEKFTKVVLAAPDLNTLTNVIKQAYEEGLPYATIYESTLNNQLTCVAIGPDFSDKINKVTGHLPLLS